MKPIIREYLASLREREELDAILPELLSALGYTVYSRPSIGVRQYGVDIAALSPPDRLTRALGDFARIVEQFDAAGVSFVSVTQAFNTTTSMGRLTLNVLLSFAQFEREVNGDAVGNVARPNPSGRIVAPPADHTW